MLSPGLRSFRYPGMALDSHALKWDCISEMTATVAKISAEVKALPERELDEFLSWLADYELSNPDRWDMEIEKDSCPGGRLDALLDKVRQDISAGRTKPLDEVINNS